MAEKLLAKTIGIALLLLLTGCAPDRSAESSAAHTWHYDQDIRERVFLACLQNAPAGPASAKFNDWDEVVEACGEEARIISAVGYDSSYAYERKPEVEK